MNAPTMKIDPQITKVADRIISPIVFSPVIGSTVDNNPKANTATPNSHIVIADIKEGSCARGRTQGVAFGGSIYS